MSDDGIVEIHGRQYHTVARRLKDWRHDHPDWTISTKVLSAADIVQVRATIKNEAGRVMATGHAEEIRGSTNILKTSALETCETSACGRALAMLGYLGTDIASAEEIARAQEQQKELAGIERLIDHNAAVREHIESIVAIKSYLLNEDYSSAYESIHELRESDPGAWESLWVATSKGGIWTTQERAQLKSDAMTEAKNDYHNGVEQ